MIRAFVRDVPASFDRALSATPPEPPIDVTVARAQHAAYVEALARLGFDVVRLAADDACPDCCFIEDAAVVGGGVALLARSGAPARRAEVEAVADALAPFVAIERMAEPATLDGGDVLRLGRTFYVGRSGRTNAAGVARLREVFAPRGFHVVPLDTPAPHLHLKSVCSGLAIDLVLLREGTLDPHRFHPARVLLVESAEAHAANAVAWGGGALVAANAPRTRARIEAAGLRTVAVDTSELRKADGALTCLSILVEVDVGPGPG